MILKSGVAKREITPPPGTPLAGRPRTYPSKLVHDPLWVRALYWEQGDRRAMLFSADLLLLEAGFSVEVREAISRELGIPLEAVVLCTTHSHSGPGVGAWFPWEGQDVYEQDLKRMIFEAAQDAQSAAFPASIRYAASRRDDLSHNRRFVMRDGSVATHPGWDEGALEPDGPIDPEIQAVLVADEWNRPRAVLVGFACHPTAMGWKEGAISADYPYWIEREVRKIWGDDTEMLFFPGALGDVSAGDWRSWTEEAGSGLAGRIGGEIGREVIRAFRNGGTGISPDLVAAHAEVSLPTVDMGPGRRRWAEEVLGSPEGRSGWEVRDARMILDMWRNWPDEIATTCSLVAVGDLAFYGIPGELFCWYGIQLKARSRFGHPFLMGLANDRVGYIADRVFPTKDIFNVPLQFKDRVFRENDDAGKRVVRAALQLAGNGDRGMDDGNPTADP